MLKREIRKNVMMMGAVDWDRRLFDSLIPLPDGTSYNAYLVTGKDKTVLLDTVDPAMTGVLMDQLQEIDKIDYLVSHHAEQDHSGSIPAVLEKHPQCRVVCTPKCRDMLMDHLGVDSDRFITVEDGDTMDLGGGYQLKFIHTPWVHWPETMCTYLEKERILFSCDFFGSHLATTDMYVTDPGRVYEAAKRYYAEIMMPFRKVITRNLDKVEALDIDIIAPSHGPMYGDPQFIIDAYREWVDPMPKNQVVIPYVSMHGSTEMMVKHLISALAQRGISVSLFELSSTDIGKLAIALVDAGTLILGAPTVHVGVHPLAHYGAYLANILRPKIRFASVVGSYGWNSNAVEQVAGLIPWLKVEILDPVICKGRPEEEDFQALDRLADQVLDAHKKSGIIREMQKV